MKRNYSAIGAYGLGLAFLLIREMTLPHGAGPQPLPKSGRALDALTLALLLTFIFASAWYLVVSGNGARA